ncbi:hypothetical protein [Bradyrhizobium sp. CB3481]|uniref:DUF3024 domain-containing protein n=1 Tax=Bradyrhizobium sp. CB3481 TaxID=3039158 RepID=UPI0024B23E22|nr:hypothetical protein [Bradyrhizobium sp. CB3481]WFU20623.1 hypothetical protein QA643_27105 [Bradyrhizobium sp. CB3481]
MNAAVMGKVVSGLIAHPNELDRKRIERALSSRKRYRYVSPNVKPVRSGYLIESLCCSGNIDRDGGLIDVAVIHHDTMSATWRLFHKDHALGLWKFHSIHRRLTAAIDELNTDPEQVFWQ